MDKDVRLTTYRFARVLLGDNSMDQFHTSLKLASKDNLTGEERDLVFYVLGYMDYRNKVADLKKE